MIITGDQPLIVTLIVYAMTKMIDPSVCNDKCNIFISMYYFDESEYNALKVSLLYYLEPAHSPNDDP